MSRVKIYVEGINDVFFLKAYFEEVLGIAILEEGGKKKKNKRYTFNNGDGEILTLGLGQDKGGYSRLNTEEVHADFRENEDESIRTLVLIDADTSNNGGGFTIRQRFLNQLREEHNLSFESFLIPNNQDDGDLETLLREILVEDCRPVLDCLDNYHNCLERTAENTGRSLNLLNEKQKLDIFRKILSQEKKINYTDNSIWNLEHEYLTPLRTFLEEHLS